MSKTQTRIIAIAMSNKRHEQMFDSIPYQKHIINIPPIIDDVSEKGIVVPKKKFLPQPHSDVRITRGESTSHRRTPSL